MPQLQLPQLQISINTDTFTTAEIWFEKTALKDWKNKVCSYLLDNPLKRKNVNFYLWEHNDFLSNPTSNEFVNELSSSNKLKGGFGMVHSKNQILKVKNVYSLIRKDLLWLIKNYYLPIIGYTNAAKVSNLKLRNRKETYLKTIKKVFRKGTESTEVRQFHKQMQLRYAAKLRTDFGESNVELEPNFIDIRVNHKNKDKVTIYEIKTGKDAHKCIRSAIGQLLFYAWRLRYEEKINNIELIVMGLGEAPTMDEFYNYVKNSLQIDLKYMKYPFSIKK